MASNHARRHFVTLGLFIIDEFSFHDENGQPTGKTLPAQESLLILDYLSPRLILNRLFKQIGGGGTYASIGARIWLPACQLGMVVDRGHDFPEYVQQKLDSYGSEAWLFRDHSDISTTRAMNSYQGQHRGFYYITPRIRVTPKDLKGTPLERPTTLHFVCSPSRAATVISEVQEIDGWFPTTIYEPIPYRCIPEHLPALKDILSSIDILSPNAEEALALLSLPTLPTKHLVEQAASRFIDMGIGKEGTGSVIIRSGAMGAYVASRISGGKWIEAFWTEKNPEKVVDVTGAGNSFLGGLAAGLLLANGDVMEAAYYATVSAGLIIEQEGLPHLFTNSSTGELVEKWNGDSPQRRLKELRRRHE